MTQKQIENRGEITGGSKGLMTTAVKLQANVIKMWVNIMPL